MSWRQDYALLAKLQHLIAKRNKYQNVQYDLHSIKTCSVKAAFSYGEHVKLIVGHGEEKVKTVAKYQGLQRCNNLWVCPVCSSWKLAFHARKIELIIEAMHKIGVEAVMATFTIPHNQHESAKEVLNDLIATRTRFFMNTVFYKKYGKITADHIGYVGKITSTECTYTKNGFHFHDHVLFFIRKDKLQAFAEAEEEMRRQWLMAYQKVHPSYYNLDYAKAQQEKKSYFLSRNATGGLVLGSKCLPRYICGWGASAELTAGKRKAGHSEDSRNMFELLASDDVHDHDLFFEYAEATHKKCRIRYSPTLKDITTQTDEEIFAWSSSEYEKKTRTVLYFEFSDWYKLMSYEAMFKTPVRYIMLELAASVNPSAVCEFVQSLGVRPPTVRTYDAGVSENVKISA